MVPGAIWITTGRVGQNEIAGAILVEDGGVGMEVGGIGEQTMEGFSVAIGQGGGQGTAPGASEKDGWHGH